MFLRQSLQIIAQRGLEAPLRLRALPIRLGRVPGANRRMIARQVICHARAAVMIFVNGRTAESAKLEKMPFTAARGGPLQTAFDDQNGSARIERAPQKILIRGAESQPFQPEIGHAVNHESVLIGIVHVVKLHVGIVLQENPSRLQSPLQVRPRIVWLRSRARHRH